MTREEFEKLVEKNYRRLFKDAMKHGAGDEDTANEIVQETLADLSQAYPSFRGESDPYTWFHAVLRNKIRDHIARETKRRQERTVARTYVRSYRRSEKRSVATEASREEKLFSQMREREHVDGEDQFRTYADDDDQSENNEIDGEFDDEASDDDPRVPGPCSVYDANGKLVKTLDPRKAWKKKEIARQEAEESTIGRLLDGISQSQLLPPDQPCEEIDAFEQRRAREEALHTAMNDAGIPEDIQRMMWRVYAQGESLEEIAKEVDRPSRTIEYEMRKWFPRLRDHLRSFHIGQTQ